MMAPFNLAFFLSALEYECNRHSKFPASKFVSEVQENHSSSNMTLINVFLFLQVAELAVLSQ